MRRREFITLLGGAAAAWPVVTRAQQAVMPIVGILGGHTSSEWTPFIAAFNLGLKEIGFDEGQNVRIEYRWAEGHYDQLPALAADLVRSRVAVIVAVGGVNSALAAKACNAGDSHYFPNRARSNRAWIRQELQSSRWQSNRH
jgi:putative ABC transport system substrate-binding protein